MGMVGLGSVERMGARAMKAEGMWKDQAIRRIRAAGLTIAQAMLMGDQELLRKREIGRKTLRWVRAFEELV